RRDRCHSEAAHPERRRPAGRTRASRQPSVRRRPRALAVRRGRARDEAPRRLGRRRRIPLKDRIGDVNDFVAAVRRVGEGGSALDPIIVSTLLSRQRPDDPLAQLTPRAREVLELMASGSSNQGIADSLVITVRAVEKYVSSIFSKLGLPSTGTEARRVLGVLLYLRSLRENPRNPPPKTTSLPSSR